MRFVPSAIRSTQDSRRQAQHVVVSSSSIRNTDVSNLNYILEGWKHPSSFFVLHEQGAHHACMEGCIFLSVHIDTSLGVLRIR